MDRNEGLAHAREERVRIAQNILSDSDKGKRRERLAAFRMDGKYHMDRSRHWDAQKDTRSAIALKKILETVDTWDDMDRLLGTDIMVHNQDTGYYHADHLKKCVAMGRYFCYLDIVPQDGGLRDKVRKLLASSGMDERNSIKREDYKYFLQQRFPNLFLRDDELGAVMDKLDVNTFVTIDGSIEDVVVLWNIPYSTRTRFSCSSHSVPKREESTSAFFASTHAYFVLETTNLSLSEILQNAYRGVNNASVEVERDAPRKGFPSSEKIILRLRQYPPEDWLREHGKRTSGEIFEESRSDFEEFFDDLIDVQDTDMLYERVFDLQERMFKKNPKTALQPFAPHNYFLKVLYDMMPWKREALEYKEWYDSQKAIEEKQAFFDTLRHIAQTRRSVQAEY